MLTKILFKQATNLHQQGSAALSPGPINWRILGWRDVSSRDPCFVNIKRESQTLDPSQLRLASFRESLSLMVSQCLYDTWRTLALCAARYKHVILNIIWKLEFFEAMNA